MEGCHNESENDFFSRELRDQTAQGSERIWIMLPSSLIISYCGAVKTCYSKQKLFAHIINFRPDRPRSLPRSPKHRLLICYECGWSKRSSSVISPSEIYCISTYFLFPGHKQKEKKNMHIEHPISLNQITVFHMCLSLHCGERAIQVREEYTSWKYFCEVMPWTS